MKPLKRWSAAICVPLLVAACSGGGGDGIHPSGNNETGAAVALGTTVELVTETIGPSGGTVQGPAGSPLEGVSVFVPPGALNGSTPVSLGYNDGSIAPVLGEHAGPILHLAAGDVTRFNEPLEITVPFPGGDTLPIPYYIRDQGTLHLLGVAGQDPTAGEYTFLTNHASLFATIYARWKPEAGPIVAILPPIDSGFRPDRDGFRVANFSSYPNPQGSCEGMVDFSRWYFPGYKRSRGDLYARFSDTVQTLLATRAMTSVALDRSLRSLAAYGLQYYVFADDVVYIFVAHALNNNPSQPVALGLYDHTGGAVGHGVLAYAAGNGRISVYDPEYPGDNARFILLPPDSGHIEPYRGYRKMVCFPDLTSVSKNEPFDNILKDAEAGFPGGPSARIDVTSHADNATVGSQTPTLRGHIDSGEVFIEELGIWINGSEYDRIDVPISGDWEATIEIREGGNDIEFYTYGWLFNRGLTSVTNGGENPFRLRGDFGADPESWFPCPASFTTSDAALGDWEWPFAAGKSIDPAVGAGETHAFAYECTYSKPWGLPDTNDGYEYPDEVDIRVWWETVHGEWFGCGVWPASGYGATSFTHNTEASYSSALWFGVPWDLHDALIPFSQELVALAETGGGAENPMRPGPPAACASE